jgi:short-subunit dehydrogenase
MLKQMIDVNVIPYAFITKLLYDKLLNRKERSGIIFMSSSMVVSPQSGHSLYCASKVFSQFLSRALSHEAREKIDVLSYDANLISTKMVGY